MSKQVKKIENGDRVNFNFAGFIDGFQFKGGTSRGFTMIIGSKQFIPGFEEQMLGMKINEEKEINTNFPVNYHAKELSNKSAIFKVKINSIKKG